MDQVSDSFFLDFFSSQCIVHGNGRWSCCGQGMHAIHPLCLSSRSLFTHTHTQNNNNRHIRLYICILSHEVWHLAHVDRREKRLGTTGWPNKVNGEEKKRDNECL